mmetsp:Transcript_24313/g.79217  ORF Transcript_24313/g.79217 Transcript_24313/m.79217 type:complete len:570 (-) Transcript_24313:905-2614(-)
MGCVTATAAAAAAAVGAIGGEAARKGDERAAVESHPLEEGRHKRRGVLRHHHEVVASRVAQRCVAGRVDGSLEGEANSRGAVRVVWCQLALLGDLCEHPLAVPLEGEHERRLREVPLFLGRHHRHLRDGEGWPARSRPRTLRELDAGGRCQRGPQLGGPRHEVLLGRLLRVCRVEVEQPVASDLLEGLVEQRRDRLESVCPIRVAAAEHGEASVHRPLVPLDRRAAEVDEIAGVGGRAAVVGRGEDEQQPVRAERRVADGLVERLDGGGEAELLRGLHHALGELSRGAAVGAVQDGERRGVPLARLVEAEDDGRLRRSLRLLGRLRLVQLRARVQLERHVYAGEGLLRVVLHVDAVVGRASGVVRPLRLLELGRTGLLRPVARRLLDDEVLQQLDGADLLLGQRELLADARARPVRERRVGEGVGDALGPPLGLPLVCVVPPLRRVEVEGQKGEEQVGLLREVEGRLAFARAERLHHLVPLEDTGHGRHEPEGLLDGPVEVLELVEVRPLDLRLVAEHLLDLGHQLGLRRGVSRDEAEEGGEGDGGRVLTREEERHQLMPDHLVRQLLA